MRATLSLLIALQCFPALSQGTLGKITVIDYSVTVDQPAYVWEPIWVHLAPVGRLRYPLRSAIGDFGCNRLELRHEGNPVAPSQLEIRGDQNGGLCGSAAPRNSPEDRLPLHVRFPKLPPGEYAVRWVLQDPDSQFPTADSIASDWTTFTILAAPAGQHEAWLASLLADAPSDPGVLAGAYIPNLTAAAPDARAMRAIARQLYSQNQLVTILAASALHFFPQDQVDALIRELLHREGPSDELARLICAPSLRNDRSRFISDSIRFLDSRDPKFQTAAIEALHNLVHYTNDQLPNSAIAAADAAILKVAPTVVSSGDQTAARQLALYLALMQTPEAHQWLWKIALAGGTAAEQARIALTWRPQPDDLQRLAPMLLEPGDSDPDGRDLSSLPSEILRAYGEDAVPWLERAVTESPYVWVRTQASEELARRHDPVAFRFLLDAIEGQRFYKDEMVRFVKDTYPSDLNRYADDAEVAKFLRRKLESKP